MLELTDANFEHSLREGKFLFMFYTDWCPLCPPIIEMLSELEDVEEGKFTFTKIELHSNPDAAKLYCVPGVPLVYAVLDGRPLYGTAGLMLIEGYRAIVHELLYDFDEAALDDKLKLVRERIAMGDESSK